MGPLEEMWMARALELARLGLGFVSPNPMVGAVLVHPEKGLVAEGYHKKFGGPHAEIDCLDSVVDLGSDFLSECTLYVSLEPCSHFGKTPPCADRIVVSGIRKVVVACLDPNPVVAGNGIKRMKNAGIEVKTGVLEGQARELNRHFFTAQERKRPWITLKWAETADGFLAPEDGKPVLISSDSSRSVVHQMRSRHMAILVGRETLRKDNPRLEVRLWTGPSPIRLVIDPDLTLPTDLHVFTDSNTPTWVFNSIRQDVEGHITWKRIEGGSFTIAGLLDNLYQSGIQSVFVEGGAVVLNQFFDSGCWDETVVFQSPKTFDQGKKAPEVQNGKLIHRYFLDGDWVSVYRPV